MPQSRPARQIASLILILALLVLTAFLLRKRQTETGNALRQIVHGQCVPDMLTNHLPSPCVAVDLKRKDAILKDKLGKTQYLVIPTDKATGIEDPAILKPNASNYFADAWDASSLVNQVFHRTLPRTDFAVAINSISGRSQDQLHIHVDCIQTTVKSELAQLGPEIGGTWQKLPVKLMGEEYRALWIAGAELKERNPFRLLADSLPHPAEEMGAHTLVLAGAERSGQPGFILLDGEAPPLAAALSSRIRLGYASGEKLEDHQCAVGNDPQK